MAKNTIQNEKQITFSWETWEQECQNTVDYLRENPAICSAFKGHIGLSRYFLDSIKLAQRIASSYLPVHIYGEAGTGKEAYARAIHALSGRGPFVAVDCATLPNDEAQRSALFGRSDKDRSGAFAQAHGGTLFLDNVDCLSPQAQSVLYKAADPNEQYRAEYYPFGSGELKYSEIRLISASRIPLNLQTYQTFYCRLPVQERLMFLNDKLAFLCKQKSKCVDKGWKSEVRSADEEIEQCVSEIKKSNIIHHPADTEAKYEEFIKEQADLNDDLFTRLCSLQVNLGPLWSRPLDAIAFLKHLAMKANKYLHPDDVLLSAGNSAHWNHLTMYLPVNELRFVSKGKTILKALGSAVSDRVENNLHSRMEWLEQIEGYRIVEVVSEHVEEIHRLWSECEDSQVVDEEAEFDQLSDSITEELPDQEQAPESKKVIIDEKEDTVPKAKKAAKKQLNARTRFPRGHYQKQKTIDLVSPYYLEHYASYSGDSLWEALSAILIEVDPRYTPKSIQNGIERNMSLYHKK